MAGLGLVNELTGDWELADSLREALPVGPREMELLGTQETFLHGVGPAPTQRGQWKARSGTQGPRPRMGSPVENQACLVPRPL